uniref:ExbD/TolR family protein n=1 Tax=Roseovarius indicus TaxID=540747 RepID=UPI003B522F63
MRNPARRRRLSMTSLIDVIFLLLLFFMLSSTFSRFSEVEISAAGSGGATESEAQMSFLQLGENSLRMNGEDIDLTNLSQEFSEIAPDAETLRVIVSLRDEVTAQRLTDVLVVLRGIDRLNINVLGS